MNTNDSPLPKDEAQDIAEEDRTGFLVRKVVAGETLLVGHNIEISVKKIGEDRAQVAVRAPKSVQIRRVLRDQYRKDPVE